MAIFNSKEARRKIESYAGKMDRKLLEGLGITVIQHQPWQFGLFHPDLEEGAKFVWYPRKGTLMYEKDRHSVNVGAFFDSEDVFNQIMKKINN